MSACNNSNTNSNNNIAVIIIIITISYNNNGQHVVVVVTNCPSTPFGHKKKPLNPPCTQMPNAKNGSEDAGGRGKRARERESRKRGEEKSCRVCSKQSAVV